MIKALIFDLDGTAIPNSLTGMPTARVVSVVNRAKERIKVACATGREIGIAKPILNAFQFTSPCIISGGSQIIDPISYQPIWKKILTAEKIKEIVRVGKDIPYILGADADPALDKKVGQYDYFSDKPIIFVLGVKNEDANGIIELLKTISGIAVIPVKAWSAGEVDIHITHQDASKRHALEEWMKTEAVSPDEMMAVGDSQNDLPLLQAAGLKIAMGNAHEELKKIADWVAPTVDDDGLAIAIEKYIL